MFTSQHECEGLNIIALVELDWQKLRVRFFLARGAIRERMRELEHPRDPKSMGPRTWPKVRLFKNQRIAFPISDNPTLP